MVVKRDMAWSNMPWLVVVKSRVTSKWGLLENGNNDENLRCIAWWFYFKKCEPYPHGALKKTTGLHRFTASKGSLRQEKTHKQGQARIAQTRSLRSIFKAHASKCPSRSSEDTKKSPLLRGTYSFQEDSCAKRLTVSVNTWV